MTSHPLTSSPPASVPPHGLRSALADSPLSVLLDAVGHAPACVRRIRSGHSLGCSCKTKAAPLDDAAIVIGLAIRFARMGAGSRLPVPLGILTALRKQVDAGDAAASLVWQWLAQRGQVPGDVAGRPDALKICEACE